MLDILHTRPQPRRVHRFCVVARGINTDFMTAPPLGAAVALRCAASVVALSCIEIISEHRDLQHCTATG
jgi:hypothetical protein